MIIRTPIELGRLVRERRRERRLTQAQLAATVGVSRKWIIGLEAGKRTTELALTLRTLGALGLGVDVRARAARAHTGPSVDLDAIVRGARKPR